MAVGPLTFSPLPEDDPLHAALEKVGELYSATNFLTWWDARGFIVQGDSTDWDPADRAHVSILAGFLEAHVLPRYISAHTPAFRDHIARVGRVSWKGVREGLLDALKHHPAAGGAKPSTPTGQFSPHTFMLLDIIEDQIAAALELNEGEKLDESDGLRCARLRPRAGSVFEGSLYQHLFLVWATTSRRALWFDLGGSQ